MQARSRDSFRKELVGIIMRHELTRDGAAPPSPGVLPPVEVAGADSAAGREILRYYYYINNGIDAENIVPLSQEWLEDVLARIPAALKVRRGALPYLAVLSPVPAHANDWCSLADAPP